MFEEWTMDFRWVLDAVESQRAAMLATDGDGLAALLFAATFPERTAHWRSSIASRRSGDTATTQQVYRRMC
jgi:hypothetical protein